MRNDRGFTLIETLIATGILLSGLVAVAYLFTYSIRTNMTNEQMTTATLLLYSKMEQLEAVPLANLAVGGGLNGASPVASYFEYVSLGDDGVITADAVTDTAPFLRLWQVTGVDPKTITVVVYAQRAGATGARMEMVRATTRISL